MSWKRNYHYYYYHYYTLVNHDALSSDDTLHTFAFHLLFTLFIPARIFPWRPSVTIVYECGAGAAFSVYVMLLTSNCT